MQDRQRIFPFASLEYFIASILKNLAQGLTQGIVALDDEHSLAGMVFGWHEHLRVWCRAASKYADLVLWFGASIAGRCTLSRASLYLRPHVGEIRCSPFHEEDAGADMNITVVYF